MTDAESALGRCPVCKTPVEPPTRACVVRRRRLGSPSSASKSRDTPESELLALFRNSVRRRIALCFFSSGVDGFSVGRWHIRPRRRGVSPTFCALYALDTSATRSCKWLASPTAGDGRRAVIESLWGKDRQADKQIRRLAGACSEAQCTGASGRLVLHAGNLLSRGTGALRFATCTYENHSSQ